MKQIFTFFSLLATVILLHAQDYSENNINYRITDATNHYVEVISSRNATGDISIPSTVSIGGTSYSVTSIGDSAFSNCWGLTSAAIPNSVTYIGLGAFYNCSGLTSVSIPNSVTYIGEGAFNYCSGLTSVTIPSSVTKIDDFTFYSCTSLTSIAIPNSVTSIGQHAFDNCTSLTSIAIPSSVTKIDDFTFYNCTSLTSVNIPNSVTSIGQHAFYNCSRLTSINIPNSVTSIGNYVFSGSGLTSINIPNSVTSIDEYAFYNCTSLTSINIPSSVTSIGRYAFYNCSGLTSIDCYITTPLSIDGSVFWNVNKSTCVLNVPYGSVSAYQSADVWKDFTSINSHGSLNTSNEKSNTNLKIYPNPATDFVVIQNTKNIKISKVQIIDTNGRTVSTVSNLENGKVDLTKLSKGLYMISVISEKGTENFKLMKK